MFPAIKISILRHTIFSPQNDPFIKAMIGYLKVIIDIHSLPFIDRVMYAGFGQQNGKQ